ncbi:hypothetical protein PYW07_005170 [Mythimna separata]|uniref:Uncharacterized protein n=1 Tax=Mythimna separata TaxID=271217 RepID=A0AAD8DPB1_MYTSE|nr:hypothetical protein PYW07_005170 [Mythimna separata]
MKFLILTIFCNLLSLGHLQETNDLNNHNLAQPDGKNDWKAQNFHSVQGNFYGQAKKNDVPCSRRSPSEKEPINQQPTPPLATKVQTITNAATPLKSQALRHADQEPKSTVKQIPLDVNLYKTRHSLTITNPVIDSHEESHREIIPTTNNEIQEDNLKPSGQMRSAPTSKSLPTSPSGEKSAPNRRDQSEPNSLVSDSEYDVEQENHYISEPSKASESNGLGYAPETSILFTDKSEDPGFSPNFDNIETQTLPPKIVAQLLAHRDEVYSNKCSHDQEPDNSIGHSRRSMSSYNDGDNKKVILSNDKEYKRSNNNANFESHIENENALASVLNAEKNTPTSNNIQHSLRMLDKDKLPTHDTSRLRPTLREARREMIEPTNGAGPMGQSALMLMQSERICYACSTANNPSCWSPDRRTTVKYCRKGNNACITKTFGQGKTFTLIRDCGNSCDDSDSTGITPKYKSCSMCHAELCNGAYSINGHSIILALILIAAVKYLN